MFQKFFLSYSYQRASFRFAINAIEVQRALQSTLPEASTKHEAMQCMFGAPEHLSAFGVLTFPNHNIHGSRLKSNGRWS
jgi:hypothetical protein